MEIDIKKLAKLARLKIDENQIAGFEKDMTGIIGMVENLPEISGDGTLIDPANPMKMREDVAESNYKRDELMKNAPQTQAGCVVVPRVVE
ncbi:MAG: Asp-tRNA(Asn)/Glu-tRNA(Gln) amidotransferase subunit GatC [Clostridiales bacterium]|nr:Asp-tRNA(Asn)/Glu-tRNA(Gln) amidotransferase subunit GatC [Clostridiales bacterium]